MPEALKNIFFTCEFMDKLSSVIVAHCPAFDKSAFLNDVYTSGWDELALKARMRHTTEALGRQLPANFRIALDILSKAEADLNHHDFDLMVFSDYVALYGLDDWEASLPALERFTQRMSAEFAVRPFIIADQPRMMAQMLTWANHEHEQVRRLATEGCRPRLPWGISLPALKADPSPILPILNRLKDDPAETVRRSVANNLNDIAKDNPVVVIDVLRGWQHIDTPEIQWITNHALRTLIKSGNPYALELIGYAVGGAFSVRHLTVEPATVALGDSITLSFTVESHSDNPQNLMIDYAMHFMKANGQLKPKVFKLARRQIAPGAAIDISRKHSFRAISTRVYYPGPHAIEIQINGQVSARANFTVTE